MSLHIKDDIGIYFIHIPRTGGRFVKKIFDKNDFQIFHNNYDQSIYGISQQHLHYPLYEWLEGVLELNTFTIIRDPFERFCSATHCIIHELYSAEEINNIVENLETKSGLENFIGYHSAITRYNSNWFRHQKQFVSSNTKIYRYENGLNENLINWINSRFKIKLVYKPFSYDGSDVELKMNILKENKKIESLIKDFYKEDYDFFDY